MGEVELFPFAVRAKSEREVNTLNAELKAPRWEVDEIRAYHVALQPERHKSQDPFLEEVEIKQEKKAWTMLYTTASARRQLSAARALRAGSSASLCRTKSRLREQTITTRFFYLRYDSKCAMWKTTVF